MTGVTRQLRIDDNRTTKELNKGTAQNGGGRNRNRRKEGRKSKASLLHKAEAARSIFAVSSHLAELHVFLLFARLIYAYWDLENEWKKKNQVCRGHCTILEHPSSGISANSSDVPLSSSRSYLLFEFLKLITDSRLFNPNLYATNKSE